MSNEWQYKIRLFCRNKCGWVIEGTLSAYRQDSNISLCNSLEVKEKTG